MKFYNIILNSAYGVGTNNSQKTYYFDWSQLMQGRYELTFSYVGQVNNLTGGTIPLLYIDVGQYGNIEILSGSFKNGTYLGFLKPYVLGTVSYLYSNDGENGSIILGTRPVQNNITVSILNNSSTQTFFSDSNSQPPANYILSLKFKLLD